MEPASLHQCKTVKPASQCIRDFFPKKQTGQEWAYCPVDSVASVACVKPWDQAPAPKKLVAAEHAFNSSTWKGRDRRHRCPREMGEGNSEVQVILGYVDNSRATRETGDLVSLKTR